MHHVKIGRDFGVTDADIRGITAETMGERNGCMSLENAVLKSARELTAGRRPSDETNDALRQGFDSQKIVDRLMAVSFYCRVVPQLGARQINVGEDCEKYLKEFPLPG